MYAQESFWDAVKRGYRRMPDALRWLITINTVIFFVQVVLPRDINDLLIGWFGLSPQASANLLQPWRLITYQFFHANPFHILFNMLWLWWMGRPVEDTVGTSRITFLYLGSGIGGGLIHAAAAAFMGGSVTIGASGAVFGVMVAFAMLYPTMPLMMAFLPPIEARFVVAGLILLDVLFLGAQDNSARIVHLGGALSGWLLFRSGFKGFSFPDLLARWRSDRAAAPSRRSIRVVEDATVIQEVDQQTLDTILDKIARKGYDGLTPEEKRLLFELSKKN